MKADRVGRKAAVVAVFLVVVGVLVAFVAMRCADPAPGVKAESELAVRPAVGTVAHGHGLENEDPVRKAVASEASPAKGVEGATEPAHRRVRGRCVTADGVVVQRGYMTWSSLLGLRGDSVHGSIVAGEFDVMLPKHIADGGHALVGVEGETRMLFSGAVRLDDYVVIQVRSSLDPDLVVTGNVTINGPSPKTWRVAAFGTNHRAVLAGEMGDDHSGLSAAATLTVLDLRGIEARQGFVLQVADASARGPGSAFAARHFDEWSQLAEALRAGVQFDTFFHLLDFGELAGKVETALLAPLDFGAPIPREIELVAGAGRVILGVPGLFSVVAKTAQGIRVRGEVAIAPEDLGSRSTVRWMLREGGSEDSTVALVDSTGQPIRDSRAWWRPEELPDGRGYELWGQPMKAQPGRVRARGLQPGRYVVHGQSLDGSRSARAVVQVPSPTEVVLELHRRGTLVIDMIQAAAFSDSLVRPEAWIRTGAGPWRVCAFDPPAYLPRVRGLAPGDYSIAIRSGDLAGVTSARVGAAVTVARVELDMLSAIKGAVSGIDRSLGPLNVAVVGGTMPWETAVVRSDGTFCLWAASSGPELVLLRGRSRTSLHRWTFDPGRPTRHVAGGR